MVDVKNNFSNKYGTDIACRLCKVQVECQEHLLKCEVLKTKVDVPSHVVYEDIFNHVDKQLEAVKILKQLLREREIIINSSRIPQTSPFSIHAAMMALLHLTSR